MARSRASARAAGHRMERETADVLNAYVSRFIDIAPRKGAKDEGDIIHFETAGENPIVVECKDVATMSIGTWVNEAEVERKNKGAIAGIVVHKRKGKGNALDQYVTMTLRDLIAIRTDKRPD